MICAPRFWRIMKKFLPSLFALAACGFTIPEARAATLVVTTAADSGAGSLRATIAAASNGDTVQFAAALNGQAITLTTHELVIDKDLVIDGPGASQLTVTRSAAAGIANFRIFLITSKHTVRIQGLSITGGRPPGEQVAVGGAIYNDGATLTIAHSTISGSSAGRGGGIYNSGINGAELTLSHSTLNGNSAIYEGGGIYNQGGRDLARSEVILDGSTIRGNSAQNGAGLYNLGRFDLRAILTINNSTISGNAASQNGGGIYNDGRQAPTEAMVTLNHCTMSGNSARIGGAVVNDGSLQGDAALEIFHSTLSGNLGIVGGGIYNTRIALPSEPARAGGGIHPNIGPTRATTRIKNTILRTGISGRNIYNDSGPFTSLGYNLSNDEASNLFTATGDQINTDPMVGPLQDNGGPTFTHGVAHGSPAIDAGDPGFVPPPDFDQRGPGFARVFGGRIDIGSFEAQPVGTKLLNVSTRLHVATDDNVLIGGLIVTGNTPKRVILRAIGPSLTNFGIAGELADPVLELHGPSGFTTIINDNWRDAQESEIQATGLAPANNLESAIAVMLPPGAYTAVVRGRNRGTGIGSIEGYDLDPAANAELANISSRGFVGSGDNAMIGGIILGDATESARVLIRAVGPSLAGLGLQNALADPALELHNGNGFVIAVNNDWKETQKAEIEMTGLQPSDDRESAVVQSLLPGPYTAIVRGTNNTTGVALVEAYHVSGASAPAAGRFTP
jgi:hypothetical protein